MVPTAATAPAGRLLGYRFGMPGRELLIAAILIGLGVFVVAGEFLPDDRAFEAPQAPRRLEIGEALDGSIPLMDLDGEIRPIGARFGMRATVLYAWSTTCPCVPVCEERMRPLYARFGAEQGVAWVAVAGEPDDEPGAIRDLVTELRAPYPVVLDPTQKLCARLGFDRASVLAILDADGYVRWRGTQGDDLASPTRDYLREALRTITAGGLPEEAEVEPAYGCAFSTPPEDCEDLALAAEIAADEP
ncbi:MAG: redoxin family protein [Planctomycetota bacterium]|jgi:hypothetical protein